MDNTDRLLFVPILPSGPGSSQNKGPNVVGTDTSNVSKAYYGDFGSNPQYNKRRDYSMLNKLAETVSNIPPETIVKTVQAVKEVGGQMRGRGRRTNHSSGYALSKAPNPKETTLDSGIVPRTYTSDYLDAKEDECSPLHLTCAGLNLPSLVSQQLYDYFLKIIAFDVQTKAQSNVGFNINVGTDFTADKILTAMNSALSAFQIYFYYQSIISYHSAFDNKNEGMIYLRARITPNMLADLTILGRRLADTPFPPRLLELCRYLSNTYYSGTNPGSPLIKLVPHRPSNTMMQPTDISDAIVSLSTTANNQVYTLLRRSVPQWTPKVLYDVDPYPVYDSNFLTIFANLPMVTGVAGYLTTPNATNSTTTMAYNSFSNELDGVAFTLTSLFTTGSTWQPGFVVPHNVVGFECNRRSYYEVAGTKGFYNSIDYAFLSRSRPETYVLSDAKNSRISLHLSGADKCVQVCSETIKDTALNVFDYLMSLDTIKSDKLGGVNKALSSKPKSDFRKGKK